MAFAGAGPSSSGLEDEAAVLDLDEDRFEYYTVLNVETTATQEEVRRAYRRLCRTYHPDRHQDPQKQQMAANFFRRIQEAYRVLSDPRTRAIYDRSGKKGLQDDMAIIERTTLPSELLEEYEKLRTLWEERTYIQEANPQGIFQMDVDASPLVDGVYLHGSQAVSIRKITMDQSVDAQLTKWAFANVVASVSSTRRSLLGGLQFSLRHLLSNQNWIKASAVVGSQPAVGLDTYHRLSDKMYLTSRNIASVSPYGIMLSMNGTVTRSLNNSTSASLSVKETGNAISAQVVHRLSETTDLIGEAQVGYSNSYVKGVIQYRPQGSKYSLRGGVKVGSNTLAAFYGAEQEIATLTRVGGTVMVGTAEGVQVRLRLIRASMSFQIRIQVSHFVSIPAVFYATMVPVLLYGCFTAFAVAPLLKRQHLKEIEDKRAEKAKEILEKKREAEAAIELMKETFERVMSQERGRHGLIILEAWYGKLFDTQADDGLAPPKVIDVHVPIQCLVVDSKVILRESTKANIPGFYDPCLGEQKYLRVLYEFRGTPHEVTIENSEPLIIPRRSHRIMNLVD